MDGAALLAFDAAGAVRLFDFDPSRLVRLVSEIERLSDRSPRLPLFPACRLRGPGGRVVPAARVGGQAGKRGGIWFGGSC